MTLSGDLPLWIGSLLNIGFVVLIGGTLFVAVTVTASIEIDRLISGPCPTPSWPWSSSLSTSGVAALGAIVGRDNPLAVAGATLAAAALFTPVRRGVQGWVDRRFDRARYDSPAGRERFSSRLRDQMELDGLTADLEGVVNRTLRPTITGVWLASARK